MQFDKKKWRKYVQICPNKLIELAFHRKNLAECLNCHFSDKNHVAAQVHVKGSFTENYRRNFEEKWVIASFRVNFFWNLKKEILFLWKKISFLSITIFSPDFYQLATLAEENHSFLCKILTIFLAMRYAYDVMSLYFVKKNNIYISKKIFCVHLNRSTNCSNYLLGC